MPIYLCKPGLGFDEPYKHAVQVYAAPFHIQNQHHVVSYPTPPPPPSSNSNHQMGMMGGGGGPRIRQNQNQQQNMNAGHMQYGYGQQQYNIPPQMGGHHPYANSQPQQHHQHMMQHPTMMMPPTHGNNMGSNGGIPIRKVRHAEVVLVDQVLAKHGSYWLRLRWPGPRGGVAGFIALGTSLPGGLEWKKMIDSSGGVVIADGEMCREVTTNDADQQTSNGRVPPPQNDIGDNLNYLLNNQHDSSSNDDPACHHWNECMEQIDDNDEEEEDDDDDDPDSSRPPLCETTGLHYPTSPAMELLGIYDDGLATLNSGLSDNNSLDDNGNNTNGSGEPVFCRICREGLHDIDYDFSMDGNSNANRRQQQQQNAPTATMNNLTGQNTPGDSNQNINSQNQNQNRRNPTTTTTTTTTTQIPEEEALQLNHPYAQNPLLAPCECAGSMAFVHYLCIEQWRCRSNHPAARNGLHCETCNARYTLPPPPTRQAATEHDEEDWLDGMPPHVLQALRNPHIWWRLGSNIVRKRWLRPIAPVIISPIVALYCRARRSLKKRGVSRRRWACSLCGRRARWKCVRCLRSYYCSRQCQNVSWHIVHKHVCYKAHRFWESFVFYGFLFVKCVPTVLDYPMIYDCGFGLLWLSFASMGILGGGLASGVKRVFHFDMRGRTLEALVVLSTLWLAAVSWGLVWAFFLGPSHCWGVFDQQKVLLNSLGIDLGMKSSEPSSFLSLPSFLPFLTDRQSTNDLGSVAKVVRKCILRPVMIFLRLIDKIALKRSAWVTDRICTTDRSASDTCFQFASTASPDFMLQKNGGEQCASDMNIVLSIFGFSGFVFIMGNIWKRRERIRRAAMRGIDGAADGVGRVQQHHQRRVHLHQD